MIKLENIYFSYGKKEILRDIRLEIKGGQFVSIIGANGSGKTTLLNVLFGLEKSQTGKIIINDKELSKYTIEERAKMFSFVSQRHDVKFPFSCLEVVMMGRNPYKSRLKPLSKEDINIVYQVMEETETIKFADTSITEISGGEYQRVILARALAQNTPILFLDEAFSAMDISYKMKAIKILKKRVKKYNLTVISVMHDMNLAYSLSDSVCVLGKGRIIAHDCPKVCMDEELIKEAFDISVEKIEGKGFFIKN